MDHPEPFPKRSSEIPQCRKDFTLEEARNFIDQVMEWFRKLEDMSDLRSMYETGKQLSRTHFDCPLYRAELAQHLTSCDYPAFASKMMKKLNNMGVFKNDDIWFSSFYFYNTTWNFSDTWPEFATALAKAGLPNLLNLNIEHQPYLENLSSKNVYYLIKASLSIIHNIARVPGNTQYFASDSVKQALLHLAQREEEFLRCVSALCLAHIITDSKLNLVNGSSNGFDLLRVLLGYISMARNSEKRRCHGFQVLEFLSALAAYSVHDPVKSQLITSVIPLSTSDEQVSEPGSTFLDLLKDLISTSLVPNATAVSIREAQEALHILWNIMSDQSALSDRQQNQLSTWLSETLSNQSALSQVNSSISRTLETISWQLNLNSSTNLNKELTECGPIFLSFAPSNRAAVVRIAERLKDAGLPISTIALGNEVVSSTDAGFVGMSMCAACASSHSQWADCIEQASVLVAFLSDAYRLSPGCRSEVERFLNVGPDSSSKPVVPVILQPKFEVPRWLSSTVTRHPIDLNSKRVTEATYDALISQIKELYGDVKKRVDAALAAAAAAATVVTPVSPHQTTTVDGKRNLALAGDTGIGAIPNPEVAMNHINAGSLGSSRASTGVSPNIKREDGLPPLGPALLSSKSLNQTMLSHSLSGVSRPLATGAWRHAIRPEVRNWSTSKVASWLKFRGLGHLPSHLAGGIDGVLLSQLAGLRIWAPEYFTQSLRSELGLCFADSLRFLEALDELAPEDEDGKNLEDGEDGMDARSHVGSMEGAASRA